ncbi:MAG: GNAT family N-acetyltransferase [Chthoniobacteraceae bacterium]
MTSAPIITQRLKLVLESIEEVRARLEAMSPSEKAEISVDWLARFRAAVSPDPWIHGFAMVLQADDVVVGNVGFKSPPGPDGVVEIAYGVALEHQGRGYATEAAALVSYAFETGQVRIVRAHTFQEPNASARILTKCGFRNVGEVVDPDDGLVWRWERENDAAPRS